MQTFNQFTSSLMEALNIDPNVVYGLNTPDYDDKEFEEDTFLSLKTSKTNFALNDEVYEVEVTNQKHKGRKLFEIEFGHEGSLKKKMLPLTKKKKQVPSNNFYGRTGARSALSVFSHVLSIASVKIKEYNPEYIAFAGADDELHSTYIRVLKSKSGRAAAASLGYYPSEHDSESMIVLVRKDVEDSDFLGPKKGKKG